LSAIARVEAFAPPSMANVGVGFDILGIALQGPGDTVIAEPRDEPGAVINEITGDHFMLPRDAGKNTATVAINAFLKQINAPHGVAITLDKGLPLSSGLGSSAASAVAGVIAANALFGEPLSREQLLPASLEGEALVSGYHADNAGPALLGGIMLINGIEINEIRHLPVPENLHLALVTPDVAVPTAEARAVLPDSVTLKAMIAQTGAIAQLIDALYRGDIEAMAAAMERDGIVEPARAHLMPLLYDIRAAAKQAGAMALVISGAGPTLCAVCDDAQVAETVAQAMHDTYADGNIKSEARATQVDRQGARVLKTE